jgi:hypothetical protein
VCVEDAEPRYLEIDPTYVAARRNLTFPFEKRGDPQGLLDILRPIGGSPPDGCVAYDRELKKNSNLPVWAPRINGLVTFAEQQTPAKLRHAVSATACHEAAASSCGMISGAR